MGAPTPITTVIPDRRSQSVGDLEKTLVTFIGNLFKDAYRLDNPGLNLVQPAQVPFDPVGRAQTLVAKVPPQVVRGRVPRTVSGEIDVNALPNFPAILVQAIKAKVQNDCTHVTVRIFANAYDEDPKSQGYQDVNNMLEVMAIALTSFGQAALDASYPIVLPIEWEYVDANVFPHFIGEMITVWELPSGRPMPDPDGCFKPAEHLDVHLEFVTS